MFKYWQIGEGWVCITDTDFICTVPYIRDKSHGSLQIVCKAIIQIYSQRNLNVARNLFLVYKNMSYPILGSINVCLQQIPEYKQYHNDVMKYFNLE